MTDIGTSPAGTMMMWDGTRWRPENGHCVLAQSAVGVTHTGSTTKTQLAAVTVPGGIMGPDGQLVVTTLWAYTGATTGKNLRIEFATTPFFSSTRTSATETSFQQQTIIRNRGAEGSQIGQHSAGNAYASSGPTLPATGTVDTSGANEIRLFTTLGDAANYCTLESYCVELYA